jgi:hypothetical protein
MSFLRGLFVPALLFLALLGLGKWIFFKTPSILTDRRVSEESRDCDRPFTDVCKTLPPEDSDLLAQNEIKNAVLLTLADLSQENLVRAFQKYLEKKGSFLEFKGGAFEAELEKLGGASAGTQHFYQSFFPPMDIPSEEALISMLKFHMLFFPGEIRTCIGGSVAPRSLEQNLKIQSIASRKVLETFHVIQNFKMIEEVCSFSRETGIRDFLRFCSVNSFGSWRTKIQNSLGSDEKVRAIQKEFLDTFFSSLSAESSPAALRSQVVCDVTIGALQVEVMRKMKSFVKELVFSKKTVRRLESVFYPNARLSEINVAFEKIKSGVEKWFVGELVPLSGFPYEKVTDLVRQLRKMNLATPIHEPDSAFSETGSFNQVVLELKNQAEIEEAAADSGLSLSQDPELTSLRFLNAYYFSSMFLPEPTEELTETMVVLPSYSFLHGRNPIGATQVMNHEVGHKFGPEVSKMNGYDLAAAYRPLLSCLRDRFDIRPEQEDEVIADWISGKVQGRVMVTLDSNRQMKSLRDFIQPFCSMLSFDSEFSRGEHPLMRDRLDQILGSVSELRRIGGCSVDLACELKGSGAI